MTAPASTVRAVARILIVEDNLPLAEGIEHNLRLEGWEPRVAGDGVQGLQVAREWRPDLVILDLMLPGIDGFEVLRTLRSEGNQVPVIILTARGEESDKVRGFRLDADQYVTKPFGLLELIERVRSQLRRHMPSLDGALNAHRIRVGSIEIDETTRSVTTNGTEVTLSPKAFELLLALARRKGAVATRHELLREVWSYSAIVLSRTVDSHIAELRRKLEEDAGDPKHIVTVWKVGYRLIP